MVDPVDDFSLAKPSSHEHLLDELAQELVYFFFSSRRRHTRCGRDWSSDVCSSDLSPLPVGLPGAQPVGPRGRHAPAERSEERRVGKERRCRRSPRHSKKNSTATAASSPISARTFPRSGICSPHQLSP